MNVVEMTIGGRFSGSRNMCYSRKWAGIDLVIYTKLKLKKVQPCIDNLIVIVVTSITGRALYGSTFSTGAVAGNLNLTVAYTSGQSQDILITDYIVCKQ